jgi:pimeloyl-ACP methyl ester carboxylesterase
MVLEMPVLENGIAGAAVAFVPLALALRVSKTSMRALSAVTRRIPRSFFLVDLLLDFVRRDPRASLAVLDGITFGRIAPPLEERRALRHPTLVIGHKADPIHPFSDADLTAKELSGARLVQAFSIAEWRIRPRRLNAELIAFLDDVWAEPRLVASAVR